MNNRNLTVAAPNEQDKAGWQELYRAYATFYHQPMTNDTLATVWSWLMDTNQPFYGLVARNDKAGVIGLMHYRQMFSPLRGKQVGFLDDLFVKPTYRQQGIAQTMFSALIEQGKKHHWPFIRWITAANNIDARNLYDKLAKQSNWLTYEMSID